MTGAEKALLITIGLAMVLVVGSQIRGGSDKAAAPASGATREDLLAELKKANEQLAADKKAAAEAAKGADKDAAKAAKDKVKADGKAINEINQKLHALKVSKAAAKTDKAAAATPAK